MPSPAPVAPPEPVCPKVGLTDILTVEATWAAYAALHRIPCSFIAGVVAADKKDRCPHDEALSRSAAATPIELNYAELLGQCSRLDLLGGRLTSVLVANELLNALVAAS